MAEISIPQNQPEFSSIREVNDLNSENSIDFQRRMKNFSQSDLMFDFLNSH